MKYIRALREAISESKKLDLEPRTYLDTSLSLFDQYIVKNICDNYLLHHLIVNYSSHDWSIMCWNIALETFKCLQHFGIKRKLLLEKLI